MATITVKGTQIEVKNINISTELAAISFDHAVSRCRFRTRNGTAFRVYTINDDADNVEYYGVPAPAAATPGNEITINIQKGEKDRTVCWIRTEAGTDVLECLGEF